jgi:rubredoxin
MFRKNYNVKINLPGGIVAAGDLYAIADAAARAKVEDMQFGARQQLFCKVVPRYGDTFLQELDRAGIFYETEQEQYPNIISSYVTEGVFGKSQWLSEGLYKDILEGFEFRPRLKLNLVENSQCLVPFFSGHLNYISSAVNNHWHLVLRLPGTNRLYSWANGVYSPDIPRLSKLIEESLRDGAAAAATANPDDHPDWGRQLYDTVGAHGLFRASESMPALQLPTFNLPYYEGFNRNGNSYWLGIYRREELFPVAFLQDVCLLAMRTKVGQLYTTPWKSLLIKGIAEQDLPDWEYVLGKFRMNVRHASNELNWQIEDGSVEGLRLKRYLVRQVDQDDVRTEGLCFAIKTTRGSGLSGSVIIRRQEGIRPGQQKLLDRYSIWHTPDLDAHSREVVLYRKDIEKDNLFPYLVSLCKEFYRRRSEQQPSLLSGMGPGYGGTDKIPPKTSGFQCPHCLTIYDERYGDPDQLVAPGTPFHHLGPEYVCPVCGAPATEFKTMEKTPEFSGDNRTFISGTNP